MRDVPWRGRARRHHARYCCSRYYFLALIDAQGHDHQATGRRHPAFNRETIKAAVVVGIDPAGNRLDDEMPRWTGLSGKDLEDLIDYLQFLSRGHLPRAPAPERM